MKLHTRTSLYFIGFCFFAFIIGGILSYRVIQAIYYNQVDENLKTEKLLVEEQINYSDSLPDFRQVFGHLIEVTVYNSPRKKFNFIKDTVLYDPQKAELQHYRHLITTNTSIQNQGYIISIYKPLDETKVLIRAIILAMTSLFIILMAFLILINYTISKRAWIPFYKTLDRISTFEISQPSVLALPDSSISEFKKLNKVLNRMTRKLRRDYITLKEFNEDASHEMQTPLAIIKSKLELLIQSEGLSEDQVQMIHSVYEATARMSKLNQGLLLLSKIENNQFTATDEIEIQSLIHKILDHFDEIIQIKNIHLEINIPEPHTIRMNKVLADILFNNLISNSIRHNIPEGKINISLVNHTLRITNTGHELQIDPKELFNRFRKSEKSSESVGLGLSIVKKIVQLYQYSIAYEYKDSIHTIKLHLH